MAGGAPPETVAASGKDTLQDCPKGMLPYHRVLFLLGAALPLIGILLTCLPAIITPPRHKAVLFHDRWPMESRKDFRVEDGKLSVTVMFAMKESPIKKGSLYIYDPRSNALTRENYQVHHQQGAHSDTQKLLQNFRATKDIVSPEGYTLRRGNCGAFQRNGWCLIKNEAWLGVPALRIPANMDLSLPHLEIVAWIEEEKP